MVDYTIIEALPCLKCLVSPVCCYYPGGLLTIKNACTDYDKWFYDKWNPYGRSLSPPELQELRIKSEEYWKKILSGEEKL